MALKLINAPGEEPVDLATAKLHCKEDYNDNDALITMFITAAREQAEHRTGRCLVTQTWELALDAFPASEIDLIKSPVQSIASVKYLDANDVLLTVDPGDYFLDNYGRRHWLIPARNVSWPSTQDAANAVLIRFVTGYGAAGQVPSSIKNWMLMAITTWYRNREAVITGTIVTELPANFFEALLDPHTIHGM